MHIIAIRCHPPFPVYLLFGLRRLQASALVPLHRLMNAAARGFLVAVNSLLLVAVLLVSGSHRAALCEPLSRWRRYARRPSCFDLVRLVRKECAEHLDLLRELAIEVDSEMLVRATA